MPHNPEKLIEDVKLAVSEILEFCEGSVFSDFECDRKLQAAVERELEIVGEALYRLRRDFPAEADQIRDLDKIIGLRNVLAHGYDMLEYEILWDVVENKLSILIHDVNKLQL